MLAPIELDDDAPLGPEAVDCPGPDLLVAPREFDPVADEELAEAPFQAALHLAVAGGVLAQRGAEVRAARVAAAQRALDVGRPEIVVELSFRESAQERTPVVAHGEVQEGARDGGGREPAVLGAVARAQAQAVEHLDARD